MNGTKYRQNHKNAAESADVRVVTSDEHITVPYIIFEGEMARSERHIKRLWIVTIILAVLLVATNIAWIIYNSTFDTISYSQDGEGINNVNIGEQGDVQNGTDNTDKTEEKRNEQESKGQETEVDDENG